MNKRERVYAAVRRTQPDAVPWQFDLTGAVIDKLKSFYQTDDLFTATDDHIMFIHPTEPNGSAGVCLDGDLIKNEFGTTWRHNAPDRAVGDWGGLVEYPLNQPSLDGYDFPDGSLSGRWPGAAEIRRKHADLFLVAGGFGLFENAWALCGFENFLSYTISEPVFVERLTEHLVDFSCAVTSQLSGLGIDGIRFGDDWGFQSGPMLPPDLWRKLYKNSYKMIYEAARNIDLVVMIHSCGNITELLPDLIDIGVDVVHPLQPEAMDVYRCKREFGKDLTFWGGLGSQSTLPKGAPADVRTAVEERIKLFSDGGYILAPAGAAPAETPPENIAAIVETAREQLIR